MKKINNSFLNALLKIAKVIATFVIWLLLVFQFTNLFVFLSTEHYQPKDVPNKHFDIVVKNHHSVNQAQKWHVAKNKPQEWVRATDTKCLALGEDCFRAKADGSLLYHNEGALWYSTSHYRIVDDKIIPISFVMFTFMHAFLAMFVAFFAVGIAKYVLKRWQLRHSVEKTALYHQRIYKQFKTVFITLGIAVFIYIFVEFFVA